MMPMAIPGRKKIIEIVSMVEWNLFVNKSIHFETEYDWTRKQPTTQHTLDTLQYVFFLVLAPMESATVSNYGPNTK